MQFKIISSWQQSCNK